MYARKVKYFFHFYFIEYKKRRKVLPKTKLEKFKWSILGSASIPTFFTEVDENFVAVTSIMSLFDIHEDLKYFESVILSMSTSYVPISSKMWLLARLNISCIQLHEI